MIGLWIFVGLPVALTLGPGVLALRRPILASPPPCDSTIPPSARACAGPRDEGDE